MTLPLGPWVLPVVITLVLFTFARMEARRALRVTEPFHMHSGRVIAVASYAAAIIVALVAWLIWALVG